MTAQSLRTRVFAELTSLGFRPANSLPLPEVGASVRPPAEVAARLMGLFALFCRVAFAEEELGSERIEGYLDRNGLRDWLTEEESAVVAMSRQKAHRAHVDTIGWRLENMWSLAWVLGFDPEPTLDAVQMGQDVTGPLFYEFLPGFDSTVADLLTKAEPRTPAEVIAMEYRFYCAHNAVRSAQLGGQTVPEGFHPVLHGGGVHERRHALSWCIDPGVPWERTDLST